MKSVLQQISFTKIHKYSIIYYEIPNKVTYKVHFKIENEIRNSEVFVNNIRVGLEGPLKIFIIKSILDTIKLKTK